MVATAAGHGATKSRSQRILAVTDDELLQHKIARLFAKEPYNLCFKKPTRRASKELSHLPDAEVVLLVPQSEMYFWIEAIHAGAWECLPKPVEEAELKAVLLRSINA